MAAQSPLAQFQAHQSDLLESGNFSDLQEAQSGVINLENDDPASVKALIEYCYRFKYEEDDRAKPNEAFLFHILVYAIGETYRIQGLKELVKKHCKHMLESDLALLGLPLAIKTIYTTTVVSDRGLRDLVVKKTRNDLQYVTALDGFDAMMGEVGEFSRDLVRSMQRDLTAYEKTPRYGCQICGAFIYMELPLDPFVDDIYCPCCKKMRDFFSWEHGRSKCPRELPKFFSPCCDKPVVMELRAGGPKIKTACYYCKAEHKNERWLRHPLRDDQQAASDS
ncbi:hypothetical protein BKA80DRAFT_303050 [Phyllosticta citrichinensis]